VYRTAMAIALPLLAPFLLLADRRRGKQRPRLSQRLGYHLPEIPQNGIWVQAVSVGEVAVARSLLAELRRRFPQIPLVLSATTATGLKLATGQQQADVVLPFPLDLPGPIRRALDAAKPRLVVLVETELWPELLNACAARGIPVVVVNARVSDRSFRGYSVIARPLATLLRPVCLALAQEEQDASRLRAMGVPADRVQVVGNIKFDQAPAKKSPQVASHLLAVAAGRPVWVAGSTMEGEERAVLEALQRIPADRRPFLLLAPRHPERVADVVGLIGARGLSVMRRTLLAEAQPGCSVIVLDTVGELAALYEIANIAFIGGSLATTGGHNPIEPARFAVPVLTGPHVRNFAAVFDKFFRVGAALKVHNEAELATAVDHWLADPAAARRAGEAGRALLDANAGATSRTVTLLEPYLR
jgi:3-deoxy-D-manno-octulosonic-acid transferase